MIHEEDKTAQQIEADNLMLVAVRAQAMAYYDIPTDQVESIVGWQFIAFGDAHSPDGRPTDEVYTSNDSGLREHELVGLMHYAIDQYNAGKWGGYRSKGFH